MATDNQEQPIEQRIGELIGKMASGGIFCVGVREHGCCTVGIIPIKRA